MNGVGGVYISALLERLYSVRSFMLLEIDMVYQHMLANASAQELLEDGFDSELQMTSIPLVRLRDLRH